MKSPMMQTKISIPRKRVDTFRRERLINLLRSYLDYKLLMVSAPAGYGKTTAIVDFISESHIPTAWYSLDEFDQDLYRFISHFIGAISVIFPQFGNNSMVLLHQMANLDINIETIVTAIINEIYDNLFEHFLIVLDDFHLVEENEKIIAFVSRFLEYVDENCHLVILSRTLTGLPNLPLMIARNQVSGMSYEDLAFQEDEIYGLFQQNFNVKLSKNQLNEIFKNSEGWITGLLLNAAQTDLIGGKLRKSFKNTGVGIDEYMGQQIIEKQPEPLQRFLYQTSLLEEFNGDLCRKVIDKVQNTTQPWESLMQEALQKNLFLVAIQDSSDKPVSLRFHHLFRDFLQKQYFLKEPGIAKSIRSRLAQVLSEEKEWDRSISILFSLNEFEAVAELLETAGGDMLAEGKYQAITEWLDKLTGPIRYKFPALLSLQGAISVMRGEVVPGILALSEAIQYLEKRDGDQYVLYQALSRRATAYRLIGDFENCEKDVTEVYNYSKSLPEQHILLTNVYREEAYIAFRQGKFHKALNKIKQVDAIYSAYGETELKFAIAIDLGSIQRAVGQYSEAEKTYENAINYFQKLGNHKTLANLYNNLGVLLHLLGRYSQSVFCFEQTIQHAKIGAYPRFEAFGLVGIGDLYMDINIIPEAYEAYNKALGIIHSINDQSLFVYVLAAMCSLNITQKDFDKFESNFDEILDQKPVNKNALASIQLLKCDYLIAIGKYSEALEKIHLYLHNFEGAVEKHDLAKANFLLLICNFQLGNFGDLDHNIIQIDKEIKSKIERFSYLRAGKNLLQYLKIINLKSTTESQKLTWIMNQISNFGEQVSDVKKRIRQHVTDLPLPPAHYEFFAFGASRVRIGNHEIINQEWQSLAARDLLFYLLNSKKGLSKDQIYEALWPDADLNDLPLRLKNTLYRLRRVIGKDAISLVNDRYHFDRSLDYEYDVESFESLISEAESIKE